ncbi:phosphatase PAP2 family protein [Candidatus Saccharibacteria bacterium]|nr:phosphatase PAP2 family protein [Candidatus Saccharibacteria bacterium]
MDNLIIFSAKYLIFIIILVVFVAWALASVKSKKQLIIMLISAGVAALLLDKLAGALYFHHRPFVTDNISPLIPHGDDNGFPSEHALLASTLATVFYFYRRRLGIALFLLAILIGTGRVFAHVHWPIDIISGLVLGIIAGWAGRTLAEKLYSPPQKASD